MERQGLILRRSGAYALDCSLVFALLVLPQVALSVTLAGLPSERLRTGTQLWTYVLATVSLPTWLYFTLCESSSWQATLGKRLLGLRVTDAPGGRPGPGRALLRTTVKLVPWELNHLFLMFPTPLFLDKAPEFRVGFVLVYALIIVYLAVIVLTHGRRGVQDFAAGTLVARALLRNFLQSR
jgi:uncharacterized RDD family membrane protein YckC